MKGILREMMDEWPGPKYDLLRRNCCSFSEAFVARLGVGPTPGWLNRLAHTGAALQDDKKAIVHGLHVVQDELHRDTEAVLGALGVGGGGGDGPPHTTVSVAIVASDPPEPPSALGISAPEFS